MLTVYHYATREAYEQATAAAQWRWEAARWQETAWKGRPVRLLRKSTVTALMRRLHKLACCVTTYMH